VRPRRAFVFSLVGFIVFNSYRLNSYGDYTQLSMLMLLIASWIALRLSDGVFSSADNGGALGIASYGNAVASGFFQCSR
jgi:hypothetical protein